MPTPTPASWLRATVATAKPRAASSTIPIQLRSSCSGRERSVTLSPRPLVETPAIAAEPIAASTPIANASTRPIAMITEIEAKDRTM